MISTDFPAQPRIAIIGSGSIGGWFAAHLIRAGHDVHLIARSTADALQAEGLDVRCAAGDFQVHPVKAVTDPRAVGPVDLVIIALKTTGNAALPGLLKPLLGPHTCVLTLQNGLGNLEFLANVVPAENLFGGICFIGVIRETATRLRNFIPDGGRTIIGETQGPATPKLQTIAQIFRQADLTCRTDDNLPAALWHKLVWNIPFNGLAIAAGGITTDRICASPELRQTARALMEEIRAAANAYGITIAPAFIDKQFPFTEAMGAYQPSTLIDFLQQRPVELQTIFAEPLRRGTAQNIPMPRLQTLHALLQSLCPNPHP